MVILFIANVILIFWKDMFASLTHSIDVVLTFVCLTIL